MSKLKRAAALLVGMVMLTISLTSCGKQTTHVAKSGDYTISTGIYVLALLQGFDEYVLYNEDYNPKNKEFWLTEVDGVTYEQKVTDYAKNYVTEYLAVQQIFDELGLSFIDGEQEAVKEQVAESWKTLAALYEPNGCSETSFFEGNLNQYKRYKIFCEIYKEGAEKAATDEEIKAYMDEHYYRIKYCFAELTDENGAAITDEAKIKEVEDALQEIVDKVNKGGDIDTLTDEYYDDDTIDTTNDIRNETYFEVGTNQIDPTVLSAVEAAKIDECVLCTTSYGVFAIKKIRPSESEPIFYEVYSDAVTELKGDEFDRYISERAAAIDVEFNEKTIAKYKASSLVIPVSETTGTLNPEGFQGLAG